MPAYLIEERDNQVSDGKRTDYRCETCIYVIYVYINTAQYHISYMPGLWRGVPGSSGNSRTLESTYTAQPQLPSTVKILHYLRSSSSWDETQLYNKWGQFLKKT